MDRKYIQWIAKVGQASERWRARSLVNQVNTQYNQSPARQRLKDEEYMSVSDCINPIILFIFLLLAFCNEMKLIFLFNVLSWDNIFYTTNLYF